MARSATPRQPRADDDALDRSLPGADFVADQPEQFNDAVQHDRRRPGESSFDVVAPDGYLHAFATGPIDPEVPARGSMWMVAVAAPTTTCLELLLAANHEIAVRGGGAVTWWRAGAGPRDDALAAQAGFHRDRAQLQLRVHLPISFDPNAADGLALDTFDFERDATDWLRVNNAAFDGHAEQGAWTLEMLEARTDEPWFDPSLFLIARDPSSNAMLGFNWLKVHATHARRHEPQLGEIYVIGVAPEAQGRGLGYALAGLGLRQLHQRNVTTGMLFVAADNEPALGLYRRLGFTTFRTDAAYIATIAGS